MARRTAKTATLRQVLAFYDTPQVAHFVTDADRHMLAVAIEDADDCRALYLGSEIGNANFFSYRNGKCDLFFIFKYAYPRKLFIFDWNMMKDGVVSLRLAPDPVVNNDENFPDREFFEEDHTEPWSDLREPTSRQKIGIAGRWEASDFSRLYAKMGDMYAFAAAVEDLADPNVDIPEKREIIEILNESELHAGGSYVAMYSQMRERSHILQPLRIASIEYHSPGHIEVEGRASVLGDINRFIEAFDIEDERNRNLYKNINGILGAENLKTAGSGARFSSEAMEELAKKQTTSLATAMGIPNPTKIFDACNSNAIVYAKVILSFYRRIRDLSRFEKEGRINFHSSPA